MRTNRLKMGVAIVRRGANAEGNTVADRPTASEATHRTGNRGAVIMFAKTLTSGSCENNATEMGMQMIFAAIVKDRVSFKNRGSGSSIESITY